MENGFKSGKDWNGNAGGRKKKPEWLNAAGEEALKQLNDIRKDPDTPKKQQIEACKIIIEQTYGKPTQAVSGPDGGPIEMKEFYIPRAERMQEERVTDGADVETEQGAAGGSSPT